MVTIVIALCNKNKNLCLILQIYLFPKNISDKTNKLITIENAFIITKLLNCMPQPRGICIHVRLPFLNVFITKLSVNKIQ